jgi:hypothetical protein
MAVVLFRNLKWFGCGWTFSRGVLVVALFNLTTKALYTSKAESKTYAPSGWERDSFLHRYIQFIIFVFESQATKVAYRSIDLNTSIILPLDVRGSSLLSEHLLARVRRVPSALALLGGLLQSIAVGARFGKQNIDLLESATSGLWAVVPHIGSGKETADQRPDEDLGTNGRNASATTEDHDPGGEPLACSAETASDVAVAKRSDFGTC